ncbi:DUF2321 domain-containing protein [Nosocomiicoccus sp. HMSC059G07]|uniref:DUF2321 domain-containing protein n=1 Tax=Nosocomiicoccus sp. HMSC059G07 TaxID=1739531 RepID=UPI0008A58301|nr:DUF2321 domain-containing protein [Nosocomiicoccus sp. HMSC059G07]OFO55635.1 hypothetical protein HMPREF3029_03415 [Nosocomiicoccus sp. HMSC059G07]
MGYYKYATICLNGHVASSINAGYRKFCKDCGEKTISVCEHCNKDIQGDYYVPGVVSIGFEYKTPSFCHECGNPYPWTERVLENALEILSLDESLSEDHKNIIQSTFPDLLIDTPDTPVAVAKYKKYMPKAAEYVQLGVKSILINLVSDTVRQSIW